MTDEEKITLGHKAEDAFRKMLDKADIPYLPFCDVMGKFSPALKNIFLTKRPDVMILIRYLGFLMIDVKYRSTSLEKPNFLFTCNEVEKYIHFREVFGHQVWYAITNDEKEHKEWFLIPSAEVIKCHAGIKRVNGEDCYLLSPDKCIKMTSFKDFLSAVFDLNMKVVDVAEAS